MARRKIIDAHQHFWDLSHGYKYPWLQDKPAGEGMLGNLAPIAQDYGPAAYLADAADYEVAGTVHIEAVPLDPLGETSWLSGLDGPLPTGLVGFAALNDPAVETIIAAHAGFAKVRGIRQIVNWHPNPALTFTPTDLLADSAWRAGYGLLRKYNLSFDMQLYANQMEEARGLAAAHPDTLMIINHTGMPADRDAEGLALWKSGMRSLASAENVVAKISGLGMVDHKWSTESIRPFVRHTIECFGVDRVMFGSNFPVDRLYSSFAAVYRAFETIVADLSVAEQDRLFHTNARRHYRL